MTISVLVPLSNDEQNLPAFFKSLQKLPKNTEVIFVDQGSEDGGAALVKAFAAHRGGSVKFFAEKRRGAADALNFAVSKATGEFLLFTSPQAEPTSAWLKEMEKAFDAADIVVGESKSALRGKSTAYGRLALKLFAGRNKQTAFAEGHALPWGAISNLGVRKDWFEQIGPFSPEAAGAFDTDWCWRAVLGGAEITFAPKAVLTLHRPNEKNTLLREFSGFGLGEAWLHRSYGFLLGDDTAEIEPLLAGVTAFNRLRAHPGAGKTAALESVLAELAAAFGSGVRSGYERPHHASALDRRVPDEAVSWQSGAKQRTVFVAGKGVTVLEGKILEVFDAWDQGADQAELEKLFRKNFKASADEAADALHDFISSLTPGSGGDHDGHDHEGHDHHH